jgi:hypothetical protein
MSLSEMQSLQQAAAYDSSRAAADQIVFGATRLVLTGFRPEKKHSIDQFH